MTSRHTLYPESIALRKCAAPPAALLLTTTEPPPFAVLDLSVEFGTENGEPGYLHMSCGLPGADGGNSGAACLSHVAVRCLELFTKNGLAVTVVFVPPNRLSFVLVASSKLNDLPLLQMRDGAVCALLGPALATTADCLPAPEPCARTAVEVAGAQCLPTSASGDTTLLVPPVVVSHACLSLWCPGPSPCSLALAPTRWL